VILVDCLLIDILCTLLSVPSALISLQSPKLTISRYTAQSSSSAPNPSSANLNQPISPLPSYQELTIPASSALPSHRRIRRQLANLLHSPLRSRTFTIRQQCLAFLAFPHAEHRCLHTYSFILKVVGSDVPSDLVSAFRPTLVDPLLAPHRPFSVSPPTNTHQPKLRRL
jgi:hypothetical protein